LVHWWLLVHLQLGWRYSREKHPIRTNSLERGIE
jgi:hypothetical protein